MIDKKVIRTHKKIDNKIIAVTEWSWVNDDKSNVGNSAWEEFDLTNGAHIKAIDTTLEEDCPNMKRDVLKDIDSINKDIFNLKNDIKHILKTREYIKFKEDIKTNDWAEFNLILQLEKKKYKVDKFFKIIDENKYKKFKGFLDSEQFSDFNGAYKREQEIDKKEKERVKKDKALVEISQWREQFENIKKDLN